MAKTFGIDIKGIAIKASGHATGAFLTTQINKISFVQNIQKPVMKGLLTTAIGYLAVPFLSEKVFGKKNIRWGLALAGFIIGIPLFYNAGFVVLVPLVFAIASATRLPLLYLALPMAASLSVTHGFLPPHLLGNKHHYAPSHSFLLLQNQSRIQNL